MRGEYGSEVDNLCRVIELDPKNAAAYHLRGQAYALKREYDRAIPDYSKALELDPKDAGAYFARSVAYRRTGEDAKAAADEKKYKRSYNLKARKTAEQPAPAEIK